MAGDDAVLCVVGVGTGCVCHLPSRDARRRLAIFSGSANNNRIKLLLYLIEYGKYNGYFFLFLNSTTIKMIIL